MKAITFTVRNVTAGQRNDAGEMVLRQIGDITLTLEGMTRTEIAEWQWATDALNTRGIDEEMFRLTVNGWKVVHETAGVVGVMLQGAGTRVHVEWYDAVNGDFFSAAWTRNLRHGAAQIVNARQHAGQGLPVDFVPEPVKAPETVPAVHPVWLENDTLVRYHGSIQQLSGGIFRVYECAVMDQCDHWDCNGYALLPVGSWKPCAVHVGIGSVTALDAQPVAA
ncbi:hypothetical protein [Streptomyces sp. NBC_00878]|uniref:hypothetical protein n=1 Tax=Streptomyces sp. NBC_00878 TaxID=2975854 RepID=UPI0022547141|nr:hypothetical protein [Streptomyces sp. NBC_00878]MCX4911843.1 hypothetical protein [Streptomyces sp. NBC_00878]